MDAIQFIMNNWGLIGALLGAILAAIGGWAAAWIVIKQKISDIADFFVCVRDAVADDNVSTEETLMIMERGKKLIGVENFNKLKCTMKITREPPQ